MSKYYSSYSSSSTRMSRGRTRDHSADLYSRPSYRSSSTDVTSVSRGRPRERSLDISASTVRSSDFSINGVERYRNRPRYENRNSVADSDDLLKSFNDTLSQKYKDQSERMMEYSNKFDHSNKNLLKEKTENNKKYAWREEMKGMEAEWKTLNVKNDESKYIEDYNQSLENIMVQIKAEKKLKDISPPPKPISYKLEIGNMDKDIKILQEKNSLRRAKLIDKYENDSNRAKSVKLEIKSKFSDCQDYDDYKTKHGKSKHVYEEPQEVKKGAWRKDMARYEEDLELSKLRKETQKKINYLDGENINHSEISTSKNLNGNLRMEKVSKPRLSSSQNPNKVPESNSVTTCVTIKLKNNSEEKIDASLTIRPCIAKSEIYVPEKTIELSQVKEGSHEKLKKDQNAPTSNKLREDMKKNEYNTIPDKKEKEIEGNKKFQIQSEKNKVKADGDSTNRINLKKELGHTNHTDSSVKPSDDKQNSKTLIKDETSKPDSSLSVTNPDNSNNKETNGQTDNDEEDEDGMKAMRKETNNTLATLEAEFEEGRSKLAAVRARIKRAREMAKSSMEE